MNMIQGGMAPMAGMTPKAQSLTDTQKQGLEDVLSNYDVENLSDSDAKEIVSQIEELGIAKGQGLASALGDAGIDARGLAEQAGIGGAEGNGGRPPPPPGGGPKGPDEASISTLQSVVEQLQASVDASDEDVDFGTMLTQALEDAGLDTSSPIVDYRV
ncbi:hypothetical protein [Yoonia sp. I 8.24]|uniref:hypothetical protein n=1 Tax=Yoonia sp. I 8.24 TaxID=1537229 RepID=UPI001EDF9EB2|nr:hypothetical protein [Yoonia sp. I 8.24]MCG3268868.1 hypothetical protein [Yoonia sp. I 8.24]